jgi:hypothetical protein
VIPLPRFRAWCLSWEEDEEHGADVVAYDIMTHDYGARVPRGVVQVPDTVLHDASDAAEAYADHVHSHKTATSALGRSCSACGARMAAPKTSRSAASSSPSSLPRR